MSKKLLVGNLSWGTDRDGLRGAFEPFGEIEDVRVITDRDTGRPRGFGFVEMANSEDADKAIQELNGQEMDGRALTVNEARERTGGGGGRGF